MPSVQERTYIMVKVWFDRLWLTISNSAHSDVTITAGRRPARTCRQHHLSLRGPWLQARRAEARSCDRGSPEEACVPPVV
jgi:hypothetical protein